MSNDFLKWAIISIIVAIISAALGLVLAFPLMLLWNGVMPAVFGLNYINWGQHYVSMCCAAFCLSLTVHLVANKEKTKN
jgi:hypothetical protein